MRKKDKPIPITKIVPEDGASDLIRSPSMRPYLNLMMKGMVDESAIEPELAEIAKLPLEQRYVWRVASAMKWGFADFDDVNVAVDRETLSEKDLKRMAKMVQLRPVQLALFLQALFGTECMEAIIKDAIRAAKDQG